MLGITFSDRADLKAWRAEVGLAADLLRDADRAVAMAYGAAESADQERPSRVSILVGPDGKVAKTYIVSEAEAHTRDALADIG